jgi:hypothetical protein
MYSANENEIFYGMESPWADRPLLKRFQGRGGGDTGGSLFQATNVLEVKL